MTSVTVTIFCSLTISDVPEYGDAISLTGTYLFELGI